MVKVQAASAIKVQATSAIKVQAASAVDQEDVKPQKLATVALAAPAKSSTIRGHITFRWAHLRMRLRLHSGLMASNRRSAPLS